MICPSCTATNDDAADMCFNCGRGLLGLTKGSVLAGRYEILERVGKGGMGIVYKVHDRELQEIVALKLLRADLARSEPIARRFRSEIRLARRVRHPNVCAIHEFGQDGDFCFITMEFIEGADLRREIRQRGALSPEDAFEVAIQLTRGLEAIHAAGIIHRDLKTPNIMRDHRGLLRLMDFGIAKQVQSEAMGPTLTGQVIGTPEYMSPEQAAGRPVDFRTDVYSLGVVVFEIFTGRVPFRGETPMDVLRKQIHDPPPFDEIGRVPAGLMPVLAKALAKAPNRRYATAAEMRAALEQARTAWFGSRVALPATPRSTTATARVLEPEATPSSWADTTDVPTAVPTPVSTPIPAWTATSSTGFAAAGRSTLTPLLSRRWVWAWVLAAAVVLVVVLLPLVFQLALWPPSRQPTAPTAEPSALPIRIPPSTTTGSAQQPHGAPVVTPGAPRPRVVHPATTADPRIKPDALPTAEALPTSSPATPEPAEGMLQFRVRPWAEVSVDGNSVGSTPRTPLKLSAGNHTVVFTHPDYKPVQRRVTITKGATARLEIDFEWEGVRK